MPAQKYDFAKLKVEYISAETWDVSTFFRDKFGKFTSDMAKRSTGWRKEKKYWKDLAATKAIQCATKDEAEAMAKALTVVRKGIVRLAVQSAENVERINPLELDTTWRLVRIESGLPTTISKQENLDLNELEVARDELDGLLNKKANAKKPILKRKRRPPVLRKPANKKKSQR